MYRILISCFCFILSLFFFFPCYAGEYELLARAYELRQEGAYDDAEEILQGFFAKNKKEWIIAHEFGFIYFETHRYKKAIEMFKQVIALRPEEKEAYEHIGRAYIRLKQYATAIEWFEKTISLFPETHFSYEGIVRTYAAQDRLDECVQWLQLQIKDYPENARFRYALSLAYLSKGDYEKAVPLLYAAKNEDEGYSCPHQALGYIYYIQGDLDSAYAEMVHGIEIAPESWFSYYYAAYYFFVLGKYEEALESLNNGLEKVERDDKRFLLKELKAYVFLFQKRTDIAEELFLGLIEQKRSSIGIFSGLGHIALQRKQYKKAEAFFSKAKAFSDNYTQDPMVPDYIPFLHLGMGWTSERLGKPQEAVDYYQMILHKEPHHLLALVSLTNVYNVLGEYDKALKIIEKAYQKYPDNGFVLAQYATVYMNIGEASAAKDYFERAIEVSSADYSCPYEGLGILYLQQGKIGRAEHFLTQAIEKNPDFEYRKYNGLAQIEIARGNYAHARKLLEKSLQNMPENEEAESLLRMIEPYETSSKK